VNVRAFGCWVNSVFLVQLRKMLGAGFGGSMRIANLRQLVAVGGLEARVPFWESRGGGMFTGGAQEMQKDSGQWAVISGQSFVSDCANQARRRWLNSCGAVVMAPQ